MQDASGDYHRSFYGSPASPDTNWQQQSPGQPRDYSGPKYNVVPGQADQCIPNTSADLQELRGEAEGVGFRVLYRDVNSVVACQLQPNARIFIAAGSMVVMSANLKLECKVKLRNMFSPSGKTFSTCVTATNGPGELILAPPMMADVMVLHFGGGTEWLVDDKFFLGSTPGVQRTQGKHMLLHMYLSDWHMYSPMRGVSCPPGKCCCACMFSLVIESLGTYRPVDLQNISCFPARSPYL